MQLTDEAITTPWRFFGMVDVAMWSCALNARKVTPSIRELCFEYHSLSFHVTSSLSLVHQLRFFYDLYFL